MAPDDDFEAWFRLLETPGVGRDTARRLLAACGSAAAVFRTPLVTLRGLVGEPLARLLLDEPGPVQAARALAARSWLNAAPTHHVLKLGDAGYPPALLQTADPPLMLYVQGDPRALLARSVAMVGSRSATAQGIDNARAFGRSLAEHGLVVVSGLAAGIDAAAHEGALSAGANRPDVAAAAPAPFGPGEPSNPGTPPRFLTVAVVGTGLDRVYPPRNQALAARIAQQGAVVSEFAPGTPALPEHFPQRNRIIAGLSLGTLVVEAALRSGSLITARLASEAGREVFAIPGSIHAAQSRGCHALIKTGAKLVESAQDIFEEFAPTNMRQQSLFGRPAADIGVADASDASPHPQQALLDALGHDPVTTDALVSRTGWPVAALAGQLLELELEGLVARLPGGLYQRRHAG